MHQSANLHRWDAPLATAPRKAPIARAPAPPLPCRGTSLMRNSAPLGPYSRTMPRAPRWSYGGGAVFYERGNPVPGSVLRAHLLQGVWYVQVVKLAVMASLRSNPLNRPRPARQIFTCANDYADVKGESWYVPFPACSYHIWSLKKTRACVH